MVVGRLLSYWEGHFSGAMLNFRRVIPKPECFGDFGGDILTFHHHLKGDQPAGKVEQKFAQTSMGTQKSGGNVHNKSSQVPSL